MSRRPLIQLGILIITVAIATPVFSNEFPIAGTAPAPRMATLVADARVKELAERADVILYGSVEATVSEWSTDEWGTHIWTTYSIRVIDSVKGAEPGQLIALRMLGGTIGDVEEVIYDVPAGPSQGASVMFLEQDPAGSQPRLVSSTRVVDGSVTVGSHTLQVSEYLALLRQSETGLGSEIPSAAVEPPDAAESPLDWLDVSSLGRKPTWGSGGPVPKVQASGLAARAADQSAFTATIYDAWWSWAIDFDGDGYYSIGSLCWDPDVVGGFGALIVAEDIFVRPYGSAQWTRTWSGAPHVIVGQAVWDVQCLTSFNVGNFGMTRGLYDIAIAVYRDGASSYDYARESGNDSDLDDVPLETISEELVVRPAITSLSPTKTSAGTAAQVTINGTNFGSQAGSVLFTYKEMDSSAPFVAGPIISWSNTRIVCEVPVCASDQCGGYRGSASSGPVYVVTASGVRSDGFAFRVSFGTDRAKWPSKSIPYYLGTSLPAGFDTAIRNAFGSWSNVAGVTASYSGTTGNAAPSVNGRSELLFGPLPAGTSSDVIALAGCVTSNGTDVTECDILFNSALPWSTASSTPSGYFDAESIALHEIGHWLKLRDLYGIVDGGSDIVKVMFGYNLGGSQWMKRVPTTDDVAGAQYLYGAATTNCTYSISPTSQSFSAASGTGSVSVMASGTSCTWQASSGVSWVTITGGSSGTGNGTVNYSVAANSSTSSRSGTLTIAGQTFSVSQSGAAACSYSISPSSRSHTAEASSGTISVTASAGGCSWTGSSGVSWVAITGGSSGTGNGTVSYSVAANTSMSSRSGSLTIAGQTFTVNQSGSGGGGTTYRYLIPAIAHSAGANNTAWRSDMSIVNRSGSSASVTVGYTSNTDSMTGSYSVTMPNGAALSWQDVLSSLFGLAQSGVNQGTVQITSTTPLCAVGRTYNQGATSTFGQAYPAVAVGEAISAGRTAILPHLANNPSTSGYRTNIGIVNLGTGACSVTVRLYDGNGNQVGTAQTISADPGKFAQNNGTFNNAGAGYHSTAYAVVSTDSASCSFWAYAAVIDNVSGDPTTIEMFPQ